MRRNGFQLDPGADATELADAFVAVIAHQADEAAFAQRLRPHVRPAG